MDKEMEEYLRCLLFKDLSQYPSSYYPQVIEYLKGIYGIYHIQFDERK